MISLPRLTPRNFCRASSAVMHIFDTVGGSRCLLIAKHLQSEIESQIPSTKDFFAYRNELLHEENSVEIDALLSCEEKLHSKILCLNKRIDDLKDGHKKKELVCTRTSLQTTENKLKDVTKRLNRKLSDSRSIVENERRVHFIFHWMIHSFEKEAIRCCTSHEAPFVSRDTAVKRFRNALDLYSSVQSKLKKEKERSEDIESKEGSCRAIEESVGEIEKHLEKYIQGVNPSILEVKTKLYEKKQTSMREFAFSEKRTKEELGK